MRDKHQARNEHVVDDELHRLLLAHQNPAALVLPVPQDPDVADAALVPRLVAGPLLEESFGEDEQLRSLVVHDLLFGVFGMNRSKNKRVRVR